MVKKIKKYLKFVVCCALILSLIAPSYAALSASDGSAFVTKAEFDSALADFNARLTTFEAGINSKIDSQVSSYLDRNGIWTKSEVTFYNMTSGTQYNINNYMLPAPYVLNGSTKEYRSSIYYTQTELGNIAHTYRPPEMDETAETTTEPRWYTFPKESDVDANWQLDFGTNNGLLKTYFDNVRNPAWNTKYYIKSNNTGNAATYNTGYSSSSVLGSKGTYLCGQPVLLVDNVQKSGLLFLTIKTDMKNDGDKRYGGQLFFELNKDTQEAGGHAYSGLNAGTTFNFNSTTFLCTTANSTIVPTKTTYESYIQSSFKPITITLNSDLRNWNTVMSDQIPNHWMKGIIENSYLWMQIGFVPDIYLLNFFVKKGESVWLVPTIGHVISAVSAASMLFGMDIAFLWNGNVSGKNTISMAFTGDVY